MTALFLLFVWPSLTLLSKIYSTLDGYSHGAFVPLVSGYATYQLWHEGKRPRLRPSWIGVPVVALGILVTLFGYWYYISLFKSLRGVAFILCSGLVICVVGFYISIGGFKALRFFRFPVLYLFFMIPLPVVVTKLLTVRLRRVASSISEDILGAIGVAVYREGNILHLPNGSLGIADACSGINSLWMLMAGAALIAFLIKLRPSAAVFLCLFSFPASIISNALRVIVTAILVYNFGEEFASGWRHELLGWFTFVGGLAIIMAFGSLFSGNEVEVATPSAKTREEVGNDFCAESRLNKMALMVSLGMALTMGALGKHIIRDHYTTHADLGREINDADLSVNATNQTRRPLSEFPDRIGSFHKIADLALDEILVEKINADEFFIRYYRNDRDEVVKLRVYYWKPLSEVVNVSEAPAEVTGHIPDNCFRASGFTWVKAVNSEIEIPGIPTPVRGRLYERSGREVCGLYWYRNTRDLTPLTSRDSLARARELFRSWKQPLVTGKTQYTVVITVDVKNTSYAAAQKSAVQFARAIAGVLPEYGID